MFESAIATSLILIVFILGYIAIVFEFNIKINKTASALVMAGLVWMFLFLRKGIDLPEAVKVLGEKLNDVSQIIFFLLGAMTIVELINSHDGFKAITDLIQTNSKRKMLWLLGILTFFLSAILDNLTTTIVIVSLLRKLIPDKKERLLLGAMVVVAANAGGAWTPIGDVTTTMLWINGNITTLNVMKALFAPSFFSLLIALFLIGIPLKGAYPQLTQRARQEVATPGARLVLFAGIGALIFVPIFKALTGLPPFMGILIGLGALWVLTDILHADEQDRQHLRIPHVLAQIDTSGVLFFLGILLCISALDAAGILQVFADFLGSYIHNSSLIAIIIGIISAVVDNVPLVAAGMGMYSMEVYPADSSFWQLLAYCAGTGGSMLIIGSAAGVALMSLEKVDFLWYLRNISWIALISYFSGIAIYWLQEIMIK
jgi:NhaD family Na+/H+ antiporter